MYVHPFKVPVGGTITIPIPTRGTDGAAVTGNTLADGDFAVHINGSTTAATIAAAATTPSSDFASATGRNQLVIDTSQDSDFAADAVCHVWLTKTIDSVATQECVGVFVMEGSAELGLRRMQAMFASHTVGGTGNTTSAVHLSGIDTGQGDDEINGELLLLYDVSEAEFHFAVITDFANTGDLATVQNIYNGGALPFTPASGDYWFRVGVAPLQATVRGRTLDVSTGGEAGIDWANIGSPTTAVNLSGTNIDTDQVVASVTGAVGSVTGNVGGNVTGSVGSVASGGITAASIANGAIDAATFAADVDAEILSYLVDDATRIDASALNTAIGTTIPAILVDTGTTLDDLVDDLESRLGTPAGASIAADIAAVKTQTAAIETDTQDIQSRLPAALTGAGNIKADAVAWNGTATNGDGSSGDKARVGT